jgi:myo-inositol-1(or 4)-monophosphatase
MDRKSRPTAPDSIVTGDDLVALEQLCIEFALAAGRLIRDDRPDALDVAATKSTETDIVTVMDQRSEELLHRLIQEARPEDGILGEEGVDVAGSSGLTWVVDPIDGTVNYLYDISAYAVSIAVVTGDAHTDGAWRPIAGAVADPSLRVVHHARRGGGAWTRAEDGSASSPRRLSVSAEQSLGHALVATGFGYDPEVRARQADVLRRVLPQIRDIRRIGSAALDLVRVADGTVDAYAESGINAWDLAAGWLIVEEAGGVVVGEGARPGKSLTVATGPALVEPLRDLFRPQG